MTLSYPKRCTAYHEAGHLVVAAYEGFQTHQIGVTVQGNGTAHVSPQLPGRSTVEYASSRLRVLLAGAVAQCLILNNGDERCVAEALKNGNARNDFAKIEELARLLAHEQHGGNLDDEGTTAATDAIIKAHLNESKEILENNLSVLSGLGSAVIYKFVELEKEEPDDMNSATDTELTAKEIKGFLDKLIR